MFIIQATDWNNDVIAVCASENKEALQSMIDEFNGQTHDSNNKLLDFEDCPQFISFGKFTLEKNKMIKGMRAQHIFAPTF